ncbi:hypothetical protein ACFVVU_36080 [Kitasatospora sp. NPDC057965]|uniref:hypothetical protein n=1 Tax=Kitasatospora sp. NPDC057965 TaxID=3346291 RepID=UPI0036DC4F65
MRNAHDVLMDILREADAPPAEQAQQSGPQDWDAYMSRLAELAEADDAAQQHPAVVEEKTAAPTVSAVDALLAELSAPGGPGDALGRVARLLADDSDAESMLETVLTKVLAELDTRPDATTMTERELEGLVLAALVAEQDARVCGNTINVNGTADPRGASDADSKETTDMHHTPAAGPVTLRPQNRLTIAALITMIIGLVAAVGATVSSAAAVLVGTIALAAGSGGSIALARHRHPAGPRNRE